MLLELAIGDAYGAGFEYVDADLIATHNHLHAYFKHPRHNIIPGHYTDDTQMSLAIAELIISGDEWTPLNIASKFVEVFKRDPREGYAGRFYRFLQDVKDGADFLARMKPVSEKSGASMRAGPIGVYPDIDTVIGRCTIQAAVTHNTPRGIAAAVASALTTHYFLYDLGPKRDLGAFLETYAPGDWTRQGQLEGLHERASGSHSLDAKRSHERVTAGLHCLHRRCGHGGDDCAGDRVMLPRDGAEYSRKSGGFAGKRDVWA